MSAEFEKAKDDNIDSRVYDILENAMGVSYDRIVFISNETPLEDFLNDDKYVPSNHELIRLSDIPADDRDLYLDESWRFPEKTYVWYPPFSDKEERRMMVRSRIASIRAVEKSHKVKMKHFKNIDEYPNLSLSQVANYVDSYYLKIQVA